MEVFSCQFIYDDSRTGRFPMGFVGKRRDDDGIGTLLAVALLAFVALAVGAPSASAHPFHYVTHRGGEVDYWPRWSPDGRTILFSRCDISTTCGGGAVTG